MRKCVGTQLRSTSHRVKISECYKEPAGVKSVPRYSRRSAHDDSSGDEEDPPIQSHEDSSGDEDDPPILSHEDSSFDEDDPSIQSHEDSSGDEDDPPIQSHEDSSSDEDDPPIQSLAPPLPPHIPCVISVLSQQGVPGHVDPPPMCDTGQYQPTQDSTNLHRAVPTYPGQS